MKTLYHLFLVFVLVVSLTACQTPEVTAYKTIGTTAVLVDASVQAYYQYRDAGNYNVELDGDIKRAYLAYQKTMAVARDLEVSFKNQELDKAVWEQIMEAAIAASDSLLELIKEVNPKLVHQ